MEFQIEKYQIEIYFAAAMEKEKESLQIQLKN